MIDVLFFCKLLLITIGDSMEIGAQLVEEVMIGAASDTCSRVLDKVKDSVASETCSRTLEEQLKVGSAVMTCSRAFKEKVGVAAETCSRVLEGELDGATSLDQYVNVWSN